MSWQLTTRSLLKLVRRINISDLPFEAGLLAGKKALA